MGFEADQPLVAGTVLIRSDIRSQDYVPGTSGWIIEADGDAEFNSVTVRGDLVVDGDANSEIRVYNNGGQPEIRMTPGNYSDGHVTALSDAVISASSQVSSPTDHRGLLLISSPGQVGNSVIKLWSPNLVGEGGPDNDKMELTSHLILIGNSSGGTVQVSNPTTFLSSITAAGGVNSGVVYQQTVTYTAGGTFTKASFPAATKVRVRLVGGGGGGGGAGVNAAGTNSTSGGGGAGGYAESWLSVSALGVSETVTVGTGGTGGAPATNGGSGNSSSFGGFVAGGGGNGGTGGGSSTTWFNVAGGQSQTGATGQLTIPGGPGTWGQRNGASYVAGQQMGGNGGSSALGFGGRGENNGTGSAGNNYGGGGGGTAGSQSTGGFTGGAGGPGIVIVDLYG